MITPTVAEIRSRIRQRQRQDRIVKWAAIICCVVCAALLMIK